MAKEYVEERNGGLYGAGTRVSLDSVVYCFRQGQSPETIQDEFPSLTLTQVYGMVTYYLENQADVDAYLARQKNRFDAERAAAPPLPEELRKKLAVAREQMRVS